MKKIWVACGTPFQANFYAPIIKELEDEFEFFVTARNHDNIPNILESKHIPHMVVGQHGGKELDAKLQAYARNIEEFAPIIKKERPDLLLTERWPEAVRVAFGFDIPVWTIFYDEREKHVNQMVFPLSSKVFTPRFYSFNELYKHGVNDPEKVVWFNGFHTGYLKGEQMPSPDSRKLGVDPPAILIRPEPDFASFFRDHKPILEQTVEILKKNNGSKFSVVVSPRSLEQKKRFLSLGVPCVPDSLQEVPLAHVNVAVGAAETMLMEAFMLGKPSVSAIYWPPSKPVVELHKYIPHYTEPKAVADAALRYLDPDEAKNFRERTRTIIENMNNPAQIMVDEIRKAARGGGEDIKLRRRSRMEIFVDIVHAAAFKPCRPTHIMRQANISYSEFKDIIEVLEKKGMVKSETTYDGKFYETTSEGLQLLSEFRSFKDRLFIEGDANS
jgi:predicted glycosyltransferase/predicted transcriptional regulator